MNVNNNKISVSLSSENKNYSSEVNLDKIKNNLKNLLGSIHKFGVTLTGLLPFSTRGVIHNLFISPVLIPIRLTQSAGPNFSQKMKAHMDHDWNRGIQDFYIDLETSDPKTQTLRKKIVADNYSYAGYMYKKNMEEGAREINEDYPSFPKLDLLPLDASPEFKQQIEDYNNKIEDYNNQISEIEESAKKDPSYDPIKNITKKLVNDMGFKCNDGNFYHTGTGTIFNLIYDSNKKEIVACFMGLGNQDWAVNNKKDKEQIDFQSGYAAGADWLGGIPQSSVQAIEIGKLLKEETKGTTLTPVMVGHSHGGGLAQTGAVANGLKAVIFNSRPMGAGTRRYIGQRTIVENANKITAFSGRGDWLSGNKAVNVLAALFERVTGIPVPRSVGTGYHLPELQGKSSLANHVFFLEEFNILAMMDSNKDKEKQGYTKV